MEGKGLEVDNRGSIIEGLSPSSHTRMPVRRAGTAPRACPRHSREGLSPFCHLRRYGRVCPLFATERDFSTLALRACTRNDN